MLGQFLTLIGATVVALLPIANPFSTAPVFVTLTRRLQLDQRRRQARLACIYMFAVLSVTLMAGALILTFFGISLAALRVAGGLVVARIGFGMLNPEPEKGLGEADRIAATDLDSMAFTPLAMPMLSGPGSIAVTIGMATEAGSVLQHVAIGIGIGLTSLLCWIVLRSSTRVVDFLGTTGVNVLTRIMGLLLVCIGIQFIFRGLFEAIVDPDTLNLLLNAIENSGDH